MRSDVHRFENWRGGITGRDTTDFRPGLLSETPGEETGDLSTEGESDDVDFFSLDRGIHRHQLPCEQHGHVGDHRDVRGCVTVPRQAFGMYIS